ncbi:Crp/Fnr family transcriptional regulator [Gordonibacter massiliensis (ex Traore et al. 2017)]|uniref:Crp/Fnr family transcriptional regulator n=1 Tax=Gordonibacter massiliensis (ex Traore et al. 2017) TaxID=1841863 RepID=UPI001C8D32F9|nr:Crp/Fnr family transcriptional regulator [Gordonibacter massiliensis (ex Traore et al. 2017)]
MNQTDPEVGLRFGPPVRRWNLSDCDILAEPSFASSCLRHPVFGELFRRKTYKLGETIRAIGTPIKEFGIVVDGCLKSCRSTVDGDELCSAYFEKDDVFPELLYFTGTKEYTYNLSAAKRTTVMWLGAPYFELMLRTDDQLLYRFMLYLSKRGLKNQMLLACLRYRTIRERVAFWLLEMDGIAQGDRVQLPASQTIWANELRVSRASLNQEIKRMERLGYFRIKGHQLELLDREGLGNLL